MLGNLIFDAGGGADLSVVTATANDVLQGKVIVGPDGEPVTGTIRSMAGGTITLNGKALTIQCANKHMSGNITVPAFTCTGATGTFANTGTTISLEVVSYTLGLTTQKITINVPVYKITGLGFMPLGGNIGSFNSPITPLNNISYYISNGLIAPRMYRDPYGKAYYAQLLQPVITNTSIQFGVYAYDIMISGSRTSYNYHIPQPTVSATATLYGIK